MKITIESFKPASSIPPADAISAIIYGVNGAGKTFLAGSAPRPLYIDTGRSKETLLSPAFKQKHPTANPLIISISEKLGKKGAADSAEAYDATCDAIDFALKEMNDQFDTVVVDELTAFGFFAQVKGIHFNHSANKSKTLDILNKQDIQAPAVQDYGAEMSLVKQFVRGYADILMRANKHFIMLAHEKKIYGKAEKIGDVAPVVGIEPLLTGKDSAGDICAQVDWVFRAEIVPASNGALYKLRTVSDGTCLAKCRHGGVFPNLVEAGSLAAMIEKVKATYKGG